MFKSIFYFGSLILLFFAGNTYATNYYISTASSGSGNANSWTNKQIYTSFNWGSLAGGDSVYFDGGTDSLVYAPISYYGLKPTSIIVITKGKDSGHNGKAIIQNTASVVNTIGITNCQNIKLTGLTINAMYSGDQGSSTTAAVRSDGSTNITVDNCNITSNGNGSGVYFHTDSICTISNNRIEVLTNTKTAEADVIHIAGYGGGHTIIGNTMIQGKLDAGYHPDLLQFGSYGGRAGTPRLTTTIANNLMLTIDVNVVLSAGINSDNTQPLRWMIYNNIVAQRGQGNTGIVLYDSYDELTYNGKSSAYILNNTFINNNGYNAKIGNTDTLVMKNNIFYMTASNNENIWYSDRDGFTPIVKDIDYNQYYDNHTGEADIDTGDASGVENSNLILAQWQTKYNYNGTHCDIQGSSSPPAFANIWGSNSTDYQLISGTGQGANLSQYFTTDIIGTTRPPGAPWDRGAVQTAVASNHYYVASNGNDANSGTSALSPWKTITKVNSKGFNSGDIISFRSGDRFTDATLTPTTDGLTFNSYNTGNRPVIDGHSSIQCVNMSNRNNINFNGLKFVNGFTGSSTDPSANIKLSNCNHITFESCNIDSSKGGYITKVGLYDEQGTYLTIRKSTLSYGQQNLSDPNQGNLGVYLDGTDNAVMEYDTLIANFSNIKVSFGSNDLGMANGLVVRYNVIKNGRFDNIDDNGSAGAEFYYNLLEATNINIYLYTDGSGTYDAYATRNGSYYNNTIITHGSEASIHLNSKSGVNNGMILKNNIFYSDNNTGYFLYEDVSGQMGSWTITNNIYYMTSANSHLWYRHGTTYSSIAQWQSIGYDANSFYSDPLFTNYASKDLSLQTGSKAISTGTNVGIATDIMGTAVPSSNPDMGLIQHTSSSLPVELTSFTGNYINNSVHLLWSTATEIENQGFEIQRNSNSSWEKIGFVAGKGNSVTKNNYSYEDNNPNGNKIQYRLKQIDNNGNFKYSNILSINIIPEGFSIGNYPNPFNPSTKIRYTIPSESMINLVIYNVIGEKIEELKNDIQQPGTYEINWNGNNHPSGIYFLSIIESPVNGSAKSSKIIKMSLIK
ncbi:MAG: hypothetical protein P4L27_06785 [Ignavibacteriaceae bacterium]|nr:hypothetical protein [Ignavibacteriaceae bacterium]